MTDDEIRQLKHKAFVEGLSTQDVCALVDELRKYRNGIRQHRDERGDDRCWMDDERLYKLLPEGYTPPPRDCAVELERCKQFILSRQNPATEYVSSQQRISELEGQVSALRKTLKQVNLLLDKLTKILDEE